ncbi:MAG: hypothetical protein RR547_07030 [Raoultibacter sp.]
MDGAVRKKRVVTVGFLAGLLALYVVGIATITLAPAAPTREVLVGYAYPLDCMVVLPALFYLLVIRRHGLSPLFVLPVMWAGAVLASFFAQGSNMTLIAVLGVGALLVEITIAVREMSKAVKSFMQAKRCSSDAEDWFFAPLMQMTGNRRASKLASNELTMFYYVFFSWKHPETSTQGETFTYHKDSGYTAAIAGMMLAIPVEMVVMHMLIAQWNDVAAWILTATSLYAIIWLIADCRASVLKPIVIEGGMLKIRSGMRIKADIPLSSVASYQREAPKGDTKRQMNLGVMGSASGWIIFAEPVVIETAFGGTKEIDALGVAVDDRARFARVFQEMHPEA